MGWDVHFMPGAEGRCLWVSCASFGVTSHKTACKCREQETSVLFSELVVGGKAAFSSQGRRAEQQDGYPAAGWDLLEGSAKAGFVFPFSNLWLQITAEWKQILKLAAHWGTDPVSRCVCCCPDTLRHGEAEEFYFCGLKSKRESSFSEAVIQIGWTLIFCSSTWSWSLGQWLWVAWGWGSAQCMVRNSKLCFGPACTK